MTYRSFSVSFVLTLTGLSDVQSHSPVEEKVINKENMINIKKNVCSQSVGF